MAGYDRRTRTLDPDQGLAARNDSEGNPAFPPAAVGSDTGDVEAKRQVIEAEQERHGDRPAGKGEDVPGVRSGA